MKIYLLLVAITLLSCQGQTISNKLNNTNVQEDTIMIDKEQVKIEYYDFHTSQNGTRSVAYETTDGRLIEIWAMENMKSGAQMEYMPANDFYENYKEYYLTGMIKQRVKLMAGVAFGRRECFDEQGNCIKIVDEDKKFGTTTPKDIIKLLEKEGWFNRQTGENIITEDSILPTNYKLYRNIERYMSITFKKAVKDNKGNEVEPPKWFIMIDPRYEMHITRYIIDGNTGRFEKKETFEPKGE